LHDFSPPLPSPFHPPNYFSNGRLLISSSLEEPATWATKYLNTEVLSRIAFTMTVIFFYSLGPMPTGQPTPPAPETPPLPNTPPPPQPSTPSPGESIFMTVYKSSRDNASFQL